jgi:hypothetical protein
VGTSPTFFVFALHASFAIEKPHRSGVITEMTLRSTVPGYLHLEIRRQVHGDNFETVLRDGEKYPILGGWYHSSNTNHLTSHVTNIQKESRSLASKTGIRRHKFQVGDEADMKSTHVVPNANVSFHLK